MQGRSNIFSYIFVAILAFIIGIFVRSCGEGSTVIYRTKTKINKIYLPKIDTVIKPDTILLSKTRTVVKHDTIVIIDKDTVKLYDTIFLERDYNTTRVYKDTILCHNKPILAISDTIRYNHIISREVSCMTPKQSDRHYFIMGGVSSEKTFIFGGGYMKRNIGGFVLYNTDKSLSLGIKVQL